MDGNALTTLNIPHLEQYLGVWAMEEQAFRAALGPVRNMDLAAHMAEVRAAAQSEDEQSAGYSIVGSGIAVIEIMGVMTKYGSSLSQYAGSLRVRRALRAAVADSDVRGIFLKVDSPGGTVAGTGDLADDVFEAAQCKPLVGYIEDIGASGAFWAASQATRLTAGPTAVIGSIGVYLIIEDWSKLYEGEGVKTYVVQSGAFKAAGVRGTKITDEQLANWQRTTNQIHELFVGSVTRGRSPSLTRDQVSQLADGRVHIGEHARALGLVDAIETLDEALAALSAIITNGGNTMGNGTKDKESALELDKVRAEAEAAGANTAVGRLKELEAAFPNDPSFARSQWEQGQSVEQARGQHYGVVVTQLGEMRGKIADLGDAIKTKDETIKAQAAEIGELKKLAGKAGAPPLDTDPASQSVGGDPITAYDATVKKLTEKGDTTPERTIAVDHPELHAAWVQAINERDKPKRKKD